MVKLKGPALSLQASGTVGQAVTISNWKGRHYLKRKSLPTDPNTPAQHSHRLMLQWLNNRWSPLTTNQQASWTDLAARKNILPRSAFIGENLRRFNLFKGPTKTYPATEDGTSQWQPDGSPFPSSRIHSVRCQVSGNPGSDTWGYFIFLLANEATPPATDKIIWITEWDGDVTQTTIVTPIRPGTYWFTMQTFSDDGKLRTPPAGSEKTVFDYS